MTGAYSGWTSRIDDWCDNPCFAKETTTACKINDLSTTPEAAFNACYKTTASLHPQAERVLMASLVAGDTVLTATMAGALTTTTVLVNQHASAALPQEWWATAFAAGIVAIGHTCLVLAPWHGPLPLKRCWCLWEILKTVESGTPLKVQLPPSEAASFETALVKDFKSIATSMSKIDVRQSEAFKPEDVAKSTKVKPRQPGVAEKLQRHFGASAAQKSQIFLSSIFLLTQNTTTQCNRSGKPGGVLVNVKCPVKVWNSETFQCQLVINLECRPKIGS